MLDFGESRALASARYAAWCLALAAMLFASVHPGWKFISVAALLLVRPSPLIRGRVLFFRDGGAFVECEGGLAFRASRVDGAWVSRWFSVLPLRDPASQQVHRLIVCAANNSPAGYRRLLQWLRLARPKASVIKEAIQ